MISKPHIRDGQCQPKSRSNPGTVLGSMRRATVSWMMCTLMVSAAMPSIHPRAVMLKVRAWAGAHAWIATMSITNASAERMVSTSAIARYGSSSGSRRFAERQEAESEGNQVANADSEDHPR